MTTRDATRRALVRGARLAGLFVALLAVFVLSLTAVYALPQGRIVSDLRMSLRTLKAEGTAPRMLGNGSAYMLDTYTDATQLDTAIVTRWDDPLERALAADHGMNAPGVLKDPIATLTDSAYGRRGTTLAYAYYWHGYQLGLRPALLVFTYGDIRWLNVFVLGLLGLAVAFGLDRMLGWEAAVAFALSLLLAGAFIVPLSLNFSPVFYVMLPALLVVMLLWRRGRLDRVDLELFLAIGMLTSFADLLTAPMLTFGMPLALVYALHGREERARTLLENVGTGFRLGFAWLAGYAGAWVAKWYLASAVLHIDVVKWAWSEVVFRGGYSARQGPRVLLSLALNLISLVPVLKPSMLLEHPLRSALILLPGLAAAAVLAWLLVRFRRPREEVARVLPVLLVAPLPYLWFAVVNNHSAQLYWFTYRIQAFAIFAVLYVALASIDWRAVRERLPRDKAAAGLETAS